MKRLLTAAAAVLSLAYGAGSASAHIIIVNPPGNGIGTVQHVGQTPPDHNSCEGHATAAGSENSAAVTFLGPPTCPTR
jgi:hypothetical protein